MTDSNEILTGLAIEGADDCTTAVAALSAPSKYQDPGGPEALSPRGSFVPERLIDSDEAAAIIGIHPKTLQRMARRGVIRGIRVGKLWRFRASAIDQWIVQQFR
jgi:excisionase family DNA binding protein